MIKFTTLCLIFTALIVMFATISYASYLKGSVNIYNEASESQALSGTLNDGNVDDNDDNDDDDDDSFLELDGDYNDDDDNDDDDSLLDVSDDDEDDDDDDDDSLLEYKWLGIFGSNTPQEEVEIAKKALAAAKKSVKDAKLALKLAEVKAAAHPATHPW